MLCAARALGAVAAAVLLLTGCATSQRLTPPTVLIAPYDTTEGDVLWAVIPPRNESGTSVVDVAMVGDAIVAAVQSTRGVRCLPVNRTIEAMRALGLEGGISTPAQAEALARSLGADAVVAGSVTAYDPYQPPTLGLALALYARPGALGSRRTDMVDPYRLTRAYTDTGFTGSNFAGSPVTVASELLDARDHQTLMLLQDYAEGRSDPTGALGWRVYLVSMDLYTKFAAHQAVRRLLDEEWLRLAREGGQQERQIP
jgi:hypothetical protein